MENMKINKRLLSILVSGATVFTLAGCPRYQKEEYVPMREIFHDDNNEGYDDAFEHIVSDSLVQIEDIEKLEKSIDILRQLLEIDFFNIYYDFPEDDMLNNIDGFSLHDLDVLEDEITVYNTMSSDSNFASKEEKEHTLNIRKSALYRKLVILRNYLDYHADYTLYHFGQKLYDLILLSTGGYNGNEKNMTAIIDGYNGSSVQPQNMATYSNDGNKETIEIIEGSLMYKLVGEVDEYSESEKLPAKTVYYTSYTEDEKKELLKRLTEYEDTLTLYKKAIATRYEIKPKDTGLLSIFEDYNYDKVIKCNETDDSVYIKK